MYKIVSIIAGIVTIIGFMVSVGVYVNNKSKEAALRAGKVEYVSDNVEALETKIEAKDAFIASMSYALPSRDTQYANYPGYVRISDVEVILPAVQINWNNLRQCRQLHFRLYAAKYHGDSGNIKFSFYNAAGTLIDENNVVINTSIDDINFDMHSTNYYKYTNVIVLKDPVAKLELVTSTDDTLIIKDVRITCQQRRNR
ncbi:MAG: hypothetical protein HQL04_07035 [Nitrospirae bacterium]|nr:hypothetical protein [Nitrospirota bacterium]